MNFEPTVLLFALEPAITAPFVKIEAVVPPPSVRLWLWARTPLGGGKEEGPGRDPSPEHSDSLAGPGRVWAWPGGITSSFFLSPFFAAGEIGLR